MTSSPEEIVKKHQEKYQNENVEDRTSRWVLGTIKYQYDFGYIIGSGALNEERAYKEKFKELHPCLQEIKKTSVNMQRHGDLKLYLEDSSMMQPLKTLLQQTIASNIKI
mgnify:CR=1 FL=1